MQVIDAQKRKRSLPRQWGCLKLFLIPILLSLACYGGMWVFARYGGEWAMSDQFSIPDNSQVLKISYFKSGALSCKTVIYSHFFLPVELRNWFTQQGELIVPRKSMDANRIFYYTDGTSRRQPHQTWTSVIYQLSLSLSTFADTNRNLYIDLAIYRRRERFVKIYPDIMLPDGMSTFKIDLCWPNLFDPIVVGLF